MDANGNVYALQQGGSSASPFAGALGGGGANPFGGVSGGAYAQPAYVQPHRSGVGSALAAQRQQAASAQQVRCQSLWVRFSKLCICMYVTNSGRHWQRARYAAPAGHSCLSCEKQLCYMLRLNKRLVSSLLSSLGSVLATCR